MLLTRVTTNCLRAFVLADSPAATLPLVIHMAPFMGSFRRSLKVTFPERHSLTIICKFKPSTHQFWSFPCIFPVFLFTVILFILYLFILFHVYLPPLKYKHHETRDLFSFFPPLLKSLHLDEFSVQSSHTVNMCWMDGWMNG